MASNTTIMKMNQIESFLDDITKSVDILGITKCTFNSRGLSSFHFKGKGN